MKEDAKGETKAYVKAGANTSAPCVKDAIEGCPVDAITMVEEET